MGRHHDPSRTHGPHHVRRCRGVRTRPHPASNRRGSPGRQTTWRVVWTAAEATPRSEGACPLPSPGRSIHQRSCQNLQRPPGHHPSLPKRASGRKSHLMTVHRTAQTHGPSCGQATCGHDHMFIGELLRTGRCSALRAPVQPVLGEQQVHRLLAQSLGGRLTIKRELAELLPRKRIKVDRENTLADSAWRLPGVAVYFG